MRKVENKDLLGFGDSVTRRSCEEDCVSGSFSVTIRVLFSWCTPYTVHTKSAAIVHLSPCHCHPSSTCQTYIICICSWRIKKDRMTGTGQGGRRHEASFFSLVFPGMKMLRKCMSGDSG